MPLDTKTVRQYLKAFDFQSLFVEELGWNRCPISPVALDVNGEGFTLTPVSEMGGMVVLRCSPESDGRVPDYATRRQIDKDVAKLYYEHIIIYCDAAETTQVWQWVKREKGKPAASREHQFFKSQSGESLIQKLNGLVFCLGDLDEEGNIPITRVVGPVRQAFDVDRVTKKFYERFSKELARFQVFIDGIQDKANTEWYASLMLNRLMFIYFIQKKGFLDGDPDYLRNHLNIIQGQKGKDKFLSFYRHFLLRLFHEGLGSKPRNPELDQLLGKIPYLNGGLFEAHDLEKDNPDIQIPDQAFENIFDFFDQYQWHLDERPLRDDREINPDVLGYIFEKYINQKQMGAYYTKEDITEYISKNTVIPFLFDSARKKCAVAFDGDNSVWRLLQDDPDRYIYDAVKAGVDLPLPDEIAAGLDDVSRRTEWNKPAPSEYALPTEIWREVVARRKRCEEVKGKLQRGEVRFIDDLITYNLDIRQFAQDVIANAEGSELIKAIWHTIAGRMPEKSTDVSQAPMTILDPTCGSGAFLFAALNILEPLYEACLDRMEAFVQEADMSGDKARHREFRSILARMNDTRKHPNREYFILKSVILGNLYGVDIMEEAVEICKLRLFLKMASVVEPDESRDNYGLEPLPDMDFNIRCGNTLVGYATPDEVRKATVSPTGQTRLIAEDEDAEFKRIDELAQEADRAYRLFRQEQELGSEVTAEHKKALRAKLSALDAELNRYLAKQYIIDPVHNKPKYEKWLASHQPFHWFVEFYGIMSHGGFDVIIGNPPYKELSAVHDYKVQGFNTIATKNLYPLIIERALPLAKLAGRLGFIVPVSSIATEGYRELQQLVFRHPCHLSSFDDRPSRLFDGLEHIQLTIHLIRNTLSTEHQLYATECMRWSSVERSHLFSRLEYQTSDPGRLPSSLPKLSKAVEASILNKVWLDRRSVGEHQVPSSAHIAYYSRKVHNFLQALDFVPEVYDGTGALRPPSELKELCFADRRTAAGAFCVLNSSLFRWYVNVFSDCRHVNKREVEGFPLNIDLLLREDTSSWVDIAERLSASLRITSEFRKMRFSHDVLRVQCIIPKKSKSLIDEVDHLLAKHYNLTDEELDFIVNYDIKYRTGIIGSACDEVE
jgi:hypothetical protein